MAKQVIDIKIQAKFNKPQFAIEDSVYFSFLGQKQYGYISKIKDFPWGVMYTVQAVNGTRYPCGIRIDGVNTQYDVGLIYFEESKQIGSAECRKRYDESRTGRSINAVPRNTGGTTTKSGNDNTTSKQDSNSVVRKVDGNTKRKHSTKNVDPPSANGVLPINRKKRSSARDSKLDDAIQKQKDFLNGFIQRD